MMEEQRSDNIELLFPRSGSEWARQELARMKRSLVITGAIIGSVFISAGIVFYFFSL